MFNDYKEIIGLIASIVILIALIMPNIKALRIINFIGATIMVVYGALIVKVPVIVMNAGSAMINIYYLTKIFTKKSSYTVIDITNNLEYYNSLNKNFENQPSLILLKDAQPISFYYLKDLDGKVVVEKVDEREISTTEASHIVNYLNNDKTNYNIEESTENKLILKTIK